MGVAPVVCAHVSRDPDRTRGLCVVGSLACLLAAGRGIGRVGVDLSNSRNPHRGVGPSRDPSSAQPPVGRPGADDELDGDGDIDLVVHFRTRDTGIACGDTEVTLTGETFDGQSVEGTDTITTVGRGCN